jgi:hypothetical protein
MIAGEDHQRRNTIRNPIIQVFHSYVQKDFGEDERNKDNHKNLHLNTEYGSVHLIKT